MSELLFAFILFDDGFSWDVELFSVARFLREEQGKMLKIEKNEVDVVLAPEAS